MMDSKQTRQPRQQRGHERRQAVLEGAAQVFDRVGFAQASLNDIAEASGATAGSMYFYFPSKKDIALAIIAEQNARTFDAMSAAPPESGSFGGLIAASQAVADLLLTDSVVRAGIRLSLEQGTMSVPTSEFYVEWMSAVETRFAAALDQGEISSDLPASALARTLVPYFTGVHVVANVLNGRADLYRVLSDMWHVLVAALVPAQQRSAYIEIVARAFGGPQPSARERNASEALTSIP